MNEKLNLPAITDKLTDEHLLFLKTFAKSCRRSILEMVTNAQSGHPGGSLSSIDFLSLIYTFILGQTGEKIVVSNGHISPAVYSVLAEMGYADKKEVISTFRKIGSNFEGHVTRHVDGVWFGTGPLGIGVSVASAFAKASKLKNDGQKVFGLFGDGEAQEGQVHEMVHFANKYKLDNLCLFVDYNDVQLSASLQEIMPIDVSAMFKAGGWHVIELDGHDYQSMWQAVSDFYTGKFAGKPVLLAAKTLMGKGIEFMEPDGIAKKASWHGKAPSAEMTMEALSKIEMTTDETALLDLFRANNVKWHPEHAKFTKSLTPMPEVKTGDAVIYEAGTVTDCRSAYGKSLLELARLNPNIVALTADLRESVKTDGVHHEFPERHIEVGIAEQNMVSVAGGLSLAGFVPFASTFGVFMSSRAKDQARVNDINQCNVKMVATHCGLSVGEDGPTHQAIDDMTSFLGMFNTHVIEPADPNQCDRIIRFIASHYGNFYVRMGRHKFAVLTKEDGTPFFDANYKFEYGKSDVIRQGSDLTIVASGACVGESLKAIEQAGLQGKVELIALNSLKHIDSTILDSVRKTGKLITVEDHNPKAGIGTMIAQEIALNGISLTKFEMLGVKEYQLSGTQADLYKAGMIDAQAIQKAIDSL